MNVWLECVAFLQNLNCDSAMYFDARGGSAQTCLIVHFFSPAYEVHICSAATWRNVSSYVEVSMNINREPSLLPNCQKFF